MDDGDFSVNRKLEVGDTSPRHTKSCLLRKCRIWF